MGYLGRVPDRHVSTETSQPSPAEDEPLSAWNPGSGQAAEAASVPMKRLQLADHRLGVVACLGLQPLRALRRLRHWFAPPPPEASAKRVLLIKFWGIGSLQLLVPAVRALRARHPDARIELLTLRQNDEFARGLDAFDAVRTFDVQGASWLRIGMRILGLVRSLRRERFDRVVDFEFFTRFSAVIALLSGAPQSTGFAAPSIWRGGFHTKTAQFNRYWHVSRNFRNLAGGENGVPVAPGDLVPFRVKPQHRAALETQLGPLAESDGRPLVVLNPNAGSLSLERRWPPERFAGLALALANRTPLRLVLVGAPSERDWTSSVAARLVGLDRSQFLNLAGHLDIGSLNALLERADLFVGNDSGPMHLAAAHGTPTLGLFGPETPVMYAPLGTRAEGLYRPPACSPCINVHNNKVASCVRGHPECLTNLEISEVFERAQALLDSRPLRLVPQPILRPGPKEVGEAGARA